MNTQQDNSVADLVSAAITDTQALVKHQIDLTKAELTQTAREAAAGSGMFVGAGVLGFLAFVFALVAGAYGMVAAGLAEWAAFLIVSGILILVAGLLALMGRGRMEKLGPPERAITAAAETKAALTARRGSPSGQAK
ncbi:MAG: phage holin family protein [Candidatus Nanopelagicales bacterium]